MEIYLSAKLIDVISQSKLNVRRTEINNPYQKIVSKKCRERNDFIWEHWKKLMTNQNPKKIDEFLDEMSWFKELEAGFEDVPKESEYDENEKSSNEYENGESETTEDEDEESEKDEDDDSENDIEDEYSSSEEDTNDESDLKNDQPPKKKFKIN